MHTLLRGIRLSPKNIQQGLFSTPKCSYSLNKLMLNLKLLSELFHTTYQWWKAGSRLGVAIMHLYAVISQIKAG